MTGSTYDVTTFPGGSPTDKNCPSCEQPVGSIEESHPWVVKVVERKDGEFVGFELWHDVHYATAGMPYGVPVAQPGPDQVSSRGSRYALP